jgi:hypothetical protein
VFCCIPESFGGHYRVIDDPVHFPIRCDASRNVYFCGDLGANANQRICRSFFTAVRTLPLEPAYSRL